MGSPVLAAPSSISAAPQSDQERAIARVIACHYGDGGVYLPRQSGRRETLRVAVASGFVDTQGFLTPKGRRLLARCGT
ncbi:MAG: hypothetical protein H6977_15690 [Gammaproteobacteria bacterium]|nr:hypothetical protein [Gammaproteobacteria bacterium]MCP5201445.1 hypothetical protein [Gammaproteobacteria bacterium]